MFLPYTNWMRWWSSSNWSRTIGPLRTPKTNWYTTAKNRIKGSSSCSDNYLTKNGRVKNISRACIHLGCSFPLEKFLHAVALSSGLHYFESIGCSEISQVSVASIHCFAFSKHALVLSSASLFRLLSLRRTNIHSTKWSLSCVARELGSTCSNSEPRRLAIPMQGSAQRARRAKWIKRTSQTVENRTLLFSLPSTGHVEVSQSPHRRVLLQRKRMFAIGVPSLFFCVHLGRKSWWKYAVLCLEFFWLAKTFGSQHFILWSEYMLF